MDGKYNRLGLYNDPSDERLIVPKRNPLLGWTINIGHPSGPLALAVIISGVTASIILGLQR